MQLYEFIKKNLCYLRIIGYLGIIFDTHFIPLQNEPSPIIVGQKLGKP